MSETLNGFRPPPTPENATAFQSFPVGNRPLNDSELFETWYQLRKKYRLRQQYTNPSADNRISDPKESQETIKNPAKEIPISPNLGKNSELKGTGFNSALEINRFFTNYNKCLKEGKTAAESLSSSLSELEANICTFTLEFIQARLVIPFLVKLDPTAKYSILSQYDGQSIVSKTSAEERFGANLHASKVIDNFMKYSPARSLAILNSPAGWTNWFDEDGKPITYTDNQMTIYWKEANGDLHALTVVSDLDYEQSKQYSTEMGVDGQKLNGDSEMEKVANIVRNPILLSFPRNGQSPVDYAIDKLLSIRGRGDIKIQKKDGTFENKKVSELIEGVRRRENMLNFCEEAEQVIGQLKEYIFSQIDNLADFQTQEGIGKIMDKAILEITRLNLPHKNSSKTNSYSKYSSGAGSYSTSSSYTPNISTWMQRNYSFEIAYLENQKGCAGGNRRSSRIGGVRVGSGISIAGSNLNEGLGGVCGECGVPNIDEHYHCPDCTRLFANETDLPPEARTKECSCGFKFGC